MRKSSIMACCAALVGASTTVSAQSFDLAGPGAPPADAGLPRLGEFRVDYSSNARPASFDRRMPDVQLGPDEQPAPQWFNPSIVIAGAKVAPDIKHKGLKVAIPVELIGPGDPIAADQGSLTN